MALPDPKFAPRRNDLPWLRRRRRPAALDQPTSTTTTRPPATGATAGATTAGPPHRAGKIDYTKRGRAAPDVTPRKAPDVTPRPAPDVTPRRAPDVTPRRAPEPAPRPAAAAAGSSLDLSGPPSPAPPPPARPTPPDPRPSPPAGDPLDLSAPTPSPTPSSSPASTGSSLDLSGPPTPPAASSSTTSLDLGGSAPPPAPTPAATTSLDLDSGSAPQPGPRPPRAATPSAAPPRHHVVRRTHRGAATLLDFGAPVVTLNRLQSGIGALTFDLVVGDEVGDLRLGAAWALTDGRTGTVDLDAGRKLGPDDRRAVVWAGREGRFERISLDLRQSRSLARLLLYGFSPTRATLAWGGTVVVITAGGDRVEAPIVSPPSPAVLALVSVYVVDGEYVVRSEMDPVAGTVRDTCRAFGYDRITWLDDRTPVT